MFTAVWLVGVALAQDLVADDPIVYFERTAIGSTSEVSVRFTAEGTVAVQDLALTNTEGQAIKYAGSPNLDVTGGSGEVRLSFEPTSKGRHAAELVVSSDATCSEPAVIEIRADAFEPCIVAFPRVIDFGLVDAYGGTELLSLRSCDGGTYLVDSALTDNSRFTVAAQSFEITPSGIEVPVQFQPVDASAQEALLTVGSWGTQVILYANDCNSGDPGNFDSDGDGTSDCGILDGGNWDDDDGDGWSEVAGDCDDSDPAVNPDMPEIDGSTDDNCNNQTEEHLDQDGDGSRPPVDCDDTNAWVGTGELEVFDGIDNNCDGNIDEGLEAPTCSVGAGEGDEKGCGCQSTPGAPLALALIPLLLTRRRSRS